ncbi:MAG: TonB-dependent receptor [Bryobacteraceae bacterium]|nr:TonB-dependent receptor [Bryobacteraceae bacterium]MDW8379378.1 TonB-dependent receptor [Bryobacterales bacterium]
MRFVLLVVLTLATVTIPLSAQVGRAGISGAVTDPSGAPIANARVQVINAETNVASIAITNEAGFYALPYLSVGTYRVVVEQPGFKRAVRDGITLQVDQRAQVDLVLEVGSLTESVTVTGEAPLVDTGSSTIGKVIENRRIQDLPINGRNVLALTLLNPAVRTTFGGNPNGFADRGIALSGMSINGGPSALNAIVIDGGNNNQGYLADVNVNPTVDAVQEFKVQTATMSAEFGFTAGGVINLVTKSGTNQFHGTLYHFFRNDKLDARNAFAVVRAPFRYNQFGGALGGPLLFPRLYNGKDRTFFFYNAEAWYYRRGLNPIGSTPIESWRRGDFSNFFTDRGQLIPIFDPETLQRDGTRVFRSPFPGNIIPQSRLDPTTLAFLRYMPLPNRTPVNPFTQQNNFISSFSEGREMQQHTAKIDHRFTDRNFFYGRYTYYRHFTNAGNLQSPWPDPMVRARFDDLRNQNVVLNDTHTFSPTLLNEFRISVARSYFPFQAASFGRNLPRELGLHPSIPSDTLPFLNNFGFANFGAFTVGLRSSTNWQFFEMLTKIKGRHTLKLGYEHRLNQANNFQREMPSHSFTFGPGLTQNPASPAGTGSAFATFLLGAVSTATGLTYLGESQKSFSSSAFFQDDWRASRRLTLNLGLRWDYQQWPRERNRGSSNFDPVGLIPNLNLRGRTIFAGIDYGPTAFEPIYNNFGPRVGLAYDVTGRGSTVFRAGYSIYYPTVFYRDHFGSTAGFAVTTTQYVPPGGDPNLPAFYFRNGLPFPPTQPLGSRLGPAAFLGQNVNYDQSQERVPMSQQWSASLQQQLKGWLLDVSYSANRGTHLVSGSYNINGVQPENWVHGLRLSQERVPNPYAGLVPGSLGAPTITFGQSLAAYPYYNAVLVRLPHMGNSTYHALLFTAERRFQQGLVMLFSYTKAKLISDSVVTPINFGPGLEQAGIVGFQDPLASRRLERAIDPTDISQRAVVSLVYELPFGRGRRYAANSNRILDTIISGWQLNTITTMQTGMPVVITGANNFRATRPNSTGQSAKLKNRNENQWFDTTQFVNPPNFTLGNIGRTLPDVRAPGLFNMDLSAIKDTRLTERFRLQTRVEAFNWLNTVNLGLPNGAFVPGPDGRNQSAAFGTIVSARDARIIQLALKLVF